MATDGGLIRTKGKVYAEQNHSKTCFADGTLSTGGLVKAIGINRVEVATKNKKFIVVTDNYGHTQLLEVPVGEDGYNKLLFLSSTGLIWVDRPGEGGVV